VFGSHGGSVKAEQPSAFENSIDDGLSEVVIVKRLAPTLRMLVGREEHRAASDVSIVDDVVEDVRGVVAVREVANLVDHEDMGSHVMSKSFAHRSFATRSREIFDELCGGGEERLEAVLQRAICDRDGEMGFAATGLAKENG